MKISNKLIEAANLALVSLGVYLALTIHTPAAIAVGAIAFFLGVVDADIKTK